VKLKLDENMHGSTATWLRSIGHDTETVVEEGLAGRDDQAIVEAAAAEGRFLITHDTDFAQPVLFTQLEESGVLVLRLGDPNRSNELDQIRRIFEEESPDHWMGFLVIATDRRIRTRKISDFGANPNLVE